MSNEEFKKEFINASKNIWVKGINNSTNSSGITFEHLLGKKADSMYFPDYYGIEIKTTTRYSMFPFSLFSIAFDGPNLYETNRVLQKYGNVDYKYKDKKTLMGNINSNTKTKLSKYSFMLDIERNERKLYLSIYEDDTLVEKQAYIDFDTIYKRIQVKLSNLVVAYASKKKIDNDLYFRYYAYKKYILKKDIDIFELLEKDILKVEMMCRVSRSGTEAGRQRNKCFIFQIEKSNIDKMYNLVDEYNFDDLVNKFNVLYL